MNTWAVLHHNRIVGVVTTAKTAAQIKRDYPPDYRVADLCSLPTDVQEAYEYWSQRP